jgi:hypothetical protein
LAPSTDPVLGAPPARGTRLASLAGSRLAALAVLVALCGLPARASAQVAEDGGMFERLRLDRLRLAGVGVAGGWARPAQVEPTQIYALHADYGWLAERWRVVFVASYWGSRYTDATVQRFADSLRAQIVDPSGDDSLDVGKIAISDITLGADLRWFPLGGRSTFLRPYVGGGVAAHVINAEGRFIAGTLMERALDDIATGLIVLAGTDALLTRRIAVGGQLRYDLVSGARFPSLRVGATYHFDAPGRRVNVPEAVR